MKRLTPEQAKEGLKLLFHMTEDEFNKLEKQYVTGNLSKDHQGFNWYLDDSIRPKAIPSV